METETFIVKDLRKKGWYQSDNLFVDKYARYFGVIGSCVYASLCRHADVERKSFPSQKLIAREFGITDRSVRTYLKLLERANVVNVIKKRGRSGGRWLRNEYELLDISLWKSPEEISSYNNHRNVTTSSQEIDDTRERNILPTNNTQSNNTHKKDTHMAKQSFADIETIIEKFKVVNPDYESFYKNTTQRKATQRLIDRMGMEQLTAVMDELGKAVAKPYCPMITSPLTLEKKLADLFIFLQRQKRDNFGGGIAGITKPFSKSKYANI